MSYKDVPAVVIDNGSGTIKAGLAGEKTPKVEFPTVVGKPHYQVTFMAGLGTYVGEEARKRRGILRLKLPVENGFIVDWDDMERVWQYTFEKQLKFAPEERAVLLTENALNPDKNREKMVQVMFEKFNVPATFVSPDAVLSLLASDRDTGLVLTSGTGIAHTVPVHEGRILLRDVHGVNVGGGDLAFHMLQLMRNRGLEELLEQEVVSELIKKHCYVALDYNKELQKDATSPDLERVFELPDGQIFKAGQERFQCPELLFQPSLMHPDHSRKGIVDMISQAVTECPAGVQKDMYANIVLAGGSTLFPGFADRLQKEVQAVAPPTAQVNVVAPPERRYSAWIGGSIRASAPAFQESWLSKQEYEEAGPSIVLKKFF